MPATCVIRRREMENYFQDIQWSCRNERIAWRQTWWRMSDSQVVIRWDHTYSFAPSTSMRISRLRFIQREWNASEKLTISDDCKNVEKAISQTPITCLRKCLPRCVLAAPACEYGRVIKALVNHPGVLTISAGKMILLLTVKWPHHNQMYTKDCKMKCSRI
jgi:hypothetical protein